MNGQPVVTLERDGDIAILRLNRPPANAINLDLCRELDARIQDVMSYDPAAVVLAGQAPFFSGGLDLKEVPTYSPEQQRALIATVNGVVAKLYCWERPLVGAITGHAIAGGFVVALVPEYRVGPAGEYWFGLTEARVGIPFPAGPMIVVEAELAPPDARYAALYAHNFGPDEALRRGALHELQNVEMVLPRALEVARDFASRPAAGYAAIKRQVRATATAKLDALAANPALDPMLDQWIDAGAPEASSAILGQRKREAT